jgi:hypothetical protein
VNLLGLGNRELVKPDVEASFRRGWLRHVKLVFTSAGGAALMFALVELLQRQPAEGFKLLSSWGPWPILAIAGLVLVGQFMGKMSDTIQQSFTAIVSSFQEGLASQVRTADALTRLADQGTRQAQEIQRMAMYAAQEFPILFQRLDRQDQALVELAELMNSVRTKVKDNAANAGGADGL